MSRFDPEQVDLAALAGHLREVLGAAVTGPVVGRTQLRDVVFDHLACSQLEAERLVDTLVLSGYLVKAQAEDGLEAWAIVVR